MVQMKDLVRVDKYVWEIPKSYRHDMRVPARIYASRTLLEKALTDKSIEQLVNATTLPGIVISLVSIAVMWALVAAKRQVGRALHSAPILADANCTRVCIYMSVVLLTASGMYELTHLPYLDAAGSLGLAWFSFKEGKECFEKASSGRYDCCPR